MQGGSKTPLPRCSPIVKKNIHPPAYRRHTKTQTTAAATAAPYIGAERRAKKAAMPPKNPFGKPDSDKKPNNGGASTKGGTKPPFPKGKGK